MDRAFYFDLASPVAYLAAERVLQELRGPFEWQPVQACELPGAETFAAFRCAREADVLRTEIERQARTLGLQPLRWPEPFPFDSELAMRAATYAKGIGRVVPFAQAAFRQAFAGGHSLARTDHVLIAAAACEMHPQAVLRGSPAALGARATRGEHRGSHSRRRERRAGGARRGARVLRRTRAGGSR